MVLQACWADLQLLLSLPFAPLTYKVVLAWAAGARASIKTRSGRLLNTSPCLHIFFQSEHLTEAQTRSAKPNKHVTGLLRISSLLSSFCSCMNLVAPMIPLRGYCGFRFSSE